MYSISVYLYTLIYLVTNMVSCAPRKMSPVVNSDPNALSGIAAGRLHTEPTVAAAHQFECIHSDQPWDKGKISKVN
jgi:hypothetical protein